MPSIFNIVFAFFKSSMIVILFCKFYASFQDCIIIYVFKFVCRFIYTADPGLVCLSCRYNVSLNVIDLIIPLVIQFDFLCLCLLYFINFSGKYVLIADVIVSSSIA